MGQLYYLGSALRQSTHARAHSLVEWLYGCLDLSVRMCARIWVCRSGLSLKISIIIRIITSNISIMIISIISTYVHVIKFLLTTVSCRISRDQGKRSYEVERCLNPKRIKGGKRESIA
jgi:hypothetical protein